MNSYFDTLGRNVTNRWHEQNFSLEAFPEIARSALAASPPSSQIKLDELIHEFLLNDHQPFQSQSGFGQPELIAFNHPRFYIQILFWLEGTTEIHQHEFSGAFHIMRGSSIHSEYDFRNAHSITPHLRLGDLHLKEVTLLETGQTVPITSGRENIHSLFHLDTPSVTIVIRTQHDPGTGPQFNYLPPHLAIDPLHVDALTARRQQLLDVLETLDDPNYPIRVREMIAALDFERSLHILRHAMPTLQSLGEWQPIFTAFQNKHGKLAEKIPATLAESLRRESLTAFRYQIHNPDHRFLLALLLNLPNRQDILAFIKKRVPTQAPLTTLLEWISDLIEPDESGATLLDATFPETFDLPFDQQAQPILAVIESPLAPSNTSSIQATLKSSTLSPLFTSKN